MRYIHIIPIGLDSPDRYILGLKTYPPAKVIFLLGRRMNIIERKAEEIKDILEEKLGVHVERETYHIDIEDFKFTLRELLEIISENKSEDTTICINISSMTKQVAQACYLAASLSDASIKMFYIQPDDYLTSLLLRYVEQQDYKGFFDYIQERGLFLSYGSKRLIEIPVFRVDKPKKDLLEVLVVLNSEKEGFQSISQLIKKIENIGKRDKISQSMRNKYNKLFLAMKKLGFIEEDAVGRSKRIKLTEEGRVIAAAADLLAE